jgi:hypothetical protein
MTMRADADLGQSMRDSGSRLRFRIKSFHTPLPYLPRDNLVCEIRMGLVLLAKNFDGFHTPIALLIYTKFSTRLH